MKSPVVSTLLPRLSVVGLCLALVGLNQAGCGAAKEPPGPPAAGVVGGKPQGLFFMVRYLATFHSLERAAWYFSPTGEVYQNVENGFSAKDLAAHKGPHGTFRITGKQMEVTWSDGKSTKGDFEQDKTTFMWDMGTFIPTQPISDVKSIVGTYEGGVSLSNGGNRIAVSKRLELHADGTYRWEGIAFVQGDTPDTTLYGSSAGGSTGTWRVSGNIATLTQSDGKVLRQVVFPYDEEGGAVHPSHLFLGGMLFKKQ